MAKGSKKLALFGFLLLPLLYAVILRRNVGSIRIWKLPFYQPQRGTNLKDDDRVSRIWDDNLSEFRSFLLQRLARGTAREELSRNGITCITNPDSDICITSSSVSVTTNTNTNATTVYLTDGQILPSGTDNFTVLPYPRKPDVDAMIRTSPVYLLPANSSHQPPPSCDITHTVPAVLFSTGGFAGNFFHDVNDLLIPLFLTTSSIQPHLRLILTDFRPWWVHKYSRILSRVSDYDILEVGSNVVHCFPAAIIGLHYHGNLACNRNYIPGNISIVDFRQFLHNSLFQNTYMKVPESSNIEEPLVVLIARRNSRTLLNEEEVINLAREIGFRVEIATPKMMWEMQEFAELVNSCAVLLGVHGAGLTNMVFLPSGAVLIQVVPWGLDWASKVYYGQPAKEMGLRYLEYHVEVEESTLHDKYSSDDPVLADPLSIHMKGYHVSKPIYIDGQDVKLNLTRFRGTLEQAFQLLPRPS